MLTRSAAGPTGGWADRWIESLKAACRIGQPRVRLWMDRVAGQVEEFTARKLVASGRSRCVLADAQFVIARSHMTPPWTGWRQQARRDRLGVVPRGDP